MLAILLFSESRDRNISDRRFELDQRMSSVMTIRRQCLAFRAEIRVVTDCALVSVANNVRLDVFAQGAITVDVIVDRATRTAERNRFVQLDKTVACMSCVSALDTIRAKVPIWAVQAFVASAIDILQVLVNWFLPGGKDRISVPCHIRHI